MNTNQLYKEYARVIEMCEGTELEDTPWVCVKVNRFQFGPAGQNNHPHFSHTHDCYEFAVAVLEGKPVFIGDALYNGYGAYLKVTENCGFIFENMSWAPPAPKRTFILNGVDLPCPEKRTQDENILFFSFDVGLDTFYFQLIEDRDKACKALINLLTEARDKP